MHQKYVNYGNNNKDFKLIQENIGLDFIIHTLSILIRLTCINHFLTLLMHTYLSQVDSSHLEPKNIY